MLRFDQLLRNQVANLNIHEFRRNSGPIFSIYKLHQILLCGEFLPISVLHICTGTYCP
jgi:hypothetical protein